MEGLYDRCVMTPLQILAVALLGLPRDSKALCSTHFINLVRACSVKEDIAKLRASPLINPNIEIYGFVYDVKVLAHAGAWLQPPLESMHGLSVLTLCAGAGRIADRGDAQRAARGVASALDRALQTPCPHQVNKSSVRLCRSEVNRVTCEGCESLEMGSLLELQTDLYIKVYDKDVSWCAHACKQAAHTACSSAAKLRARLTNAWYQGVNAGHVNAR